MNLFIFPRRVRTLEISSSHLDRSFWAHLAEQPCGEEVEEFRVSAASSQANPHYPPWTAIPFRNLRILSATMTRFLADDEMPFDTAHTNHSCLFPAGFDVAVFKQTAAGASNHRRPRACLCSRVTAETSCRSS